MAPRRRSTVGQAVKAARKALTRGGPPRASGADESVRTTKADAGRSTGSTPKRADQQTPAKRSPAKKTPAKKTPAKKTTTAAKKTAAKKAATTPTKTTKAKKSTASGNNSGAARVPAAGTAEPTTRRSSTRSDSRPTSATRKAAPTKKANAVAKKETITGVIDPTSLKVREGEDPWTQEEVEEVIGELNQMRAHSLEVLAAQEAELSGLMRDSGDGAGQDQADMGATSFERDHELTVVNSERDKLAQIDRAFTYLQDGTYGVCESCGQPIGKMRLLAFPRATLCMPCKQREERR